MTCSTSCRLAFLPNKWSDSKTIISVDYYSLLSLIISLLFSAILLYSRSERAAIDGWLKAIRSEQEWLMSKPVQGHLEEKVDPVKLLEWFWWGYLRSVLFPAAPAGVRSSCSEIKFKRGGSCCGINCGCAALCWPVTTIGLYDSLNVPFFARCASLGPDNGFIFVSLLCRDLLRHHSTPAMPHPAPSLAPALHLSTLLGQLGLDSHCWLHPRPNLTFRGLLLGGQAWDLSAFVGSRICGY